MRNFIAVHAAQRIYNIKRIGVQSIYFLHQLKQFDITIEYCTHGLHKHMIPFFHDDSGPFKRLLHFIFMKSQSNPLDPLPIIWIELRWMKFFFSNSNHSYIHGVSLSIRKNLFNLSGTVKKGALLFLNHSSEKSTFNNIDVGLI